MIQNIMSKMRDIFGAPNWKYTHMNFRPVPARCHSKKAWKKRNKARRK